MFVLIFGDSITQGMWDSRGGWAQRLIDDYFALQMRDLDKDVPMVANLGVSADTTVELLARFEHEAMARQRPEMAFVFAIGTNDSRIDGAKPFSTPEKYAANLERLIDQAKQFVAPDRLLFVGLQPCDETRTMPVSWCDVTYTNERLQAFDQALRQACTKHKTAHIPIFEVFQNAQAKQQLLIDGLHPGDAGHRLIYEQVKPTLGSLLSRVS